MYELNDTEVEALERQLRHERHVLSVGMKQTVETIVQAHIDSEREGAAAAQRYKKMQEREMTLTPEEAKTLGLGSINRAARWWDRVCPSWWPLGPAATFAVWLYLICFLWLFFVGSVVR